MNNLKTDLKRILEKTQDRTLQDNISSFWKQELKIYIDGLYTLDSNIEHNKISKAHAESEFFMLTDEIMQKAENLEKRLSQKIVVKMVKQGFREMVGEWIYKGLIVKRAYEKPRGYPGDYLTLEYIYDNKPISDNIGCLSDRYFLENEYAIAVRNRKEKMKEIMSDFIRENTNSQIKILNLACGSCREIKELFIDDKVFSNKKVIFTLVDQDEEALEFAKNIFKQAPSNLTFNYYKYDLIRLNEVIGKEFDQQDFIYSIGLADYLPDRVLKNFIKFCINRLLPKGRFIITHKDIERCHPVSPDWFCDWYFYSRNEKHLVDLIRSIGITNFDLDTIIREKSKRILFATTSKKA